MHSSNFRVLLGVLCVTLVGASGCNCSDPVAGSSADNRPCQAVVKKSGSVPAGTNRLKDLASLAPGWRGRIVAELDQSYVGWDVEIGDADNDGKNEILVTGCPDSRLYLFKKVADQWQTRLLAQDLAKRSPLPGMGLAVKVVDLNRDGKNEIILGTGQEGKTAGPAFFYVMSTDGHKITHQAAAQAFLENSLFTHNFGVYDIDGDGLQEVISAYCGTGEVTRYDVNRELTQIRPRQIYHSTGSGEDSFIADIDNDGKVEYLTCDCYRKDQAKVHIFEFDRHGELIVPPRITLDGFDGMKCFNCSLETGDIDNDGANELIVSWKRKPDINSGTILGYRVDGQGATPIYTFAREDETLDLGYAEKMMCVADADNDGKNELVVTTRGEPRWGGRGMGHVFMFKIHAPDRIQRTLIVDFHDGKADAVWPAVGDADNDGLNEIVIATGVGHREKPGRSHVVIIEKD
jgi:hypothetical protein